MAEPAPNTDLSGKGFSAASNDQTQQGYPLPGAAHDFPSAGNEKSEPLVDSSNTSQLKNGSDSDINGATHGLVDNEKASLSEKPRSPRKISGVKWILVVISILSSTFLFALDNTVVADVQPKIIERFGEIEKLPWLSIGFLVASVATNNIW